jgi:branched-chain amino acid transport system substrate-binding protein
MEDKRMLRLLLGVVIAAAFVNAAAAEDAYVVGMTAGLTGPTASTFAPVAEAMRIYFDRVNAAGGINGRPVKLVILDDQGEPQKAGANVKQLLTWNNAILLIDSSLSSTFAPAIGEAKRANVPLLFIGSVCPKEVYPPAEAGQYCTTAFASNFDSRASLTFVKGTSSEPARIGFAAATIPVSRAEIDFAEKYATDLGMAAVDKELIPPTTADFTPFATKLVAAKPSWVYSWAAWVIQVQLFEAMRRLGWEGNFIGWAHQEAEDELKRLKDPHLYVIGANALFQEQLPVQKEIEGAAAKAASRYPANQMSEGWIGGLMIEAALEHASWPVTAAKVQDALQNLQVDMKGIRAAPMEWTQTNHFRTLQSYRIYNWDAAKGQIATTKKGLDYEIK